MPDHETPEFRPAPERFVHPPGHCGRAGLRGSGRSCLVVLAAP